MGTSVKIHPHLVQSIVQCLGEIFNTGKYADKVIEKFLKGHPKWGSRDRKFFAESVYHSVRHRRLLFYALNGLLDNSYLELNDEKNLEKLWALAHFHLHEEIPEYSQQKMIIDQVCLDRLSHPPTVQHRFSFPDEFSDYAEKVFENQWPAIAESLNRTNDVFLRTNRLKTTPQELLNILTEEGCPAESVLQLPDALRLIQRKNVFSLKSFQEGRFEVQDAGSQMIAPLLQPEPGMRVVDACAGAGGKSLHLAALMKNKGKILSLDIHEWKLTELKRRARRNGVDIIETRLIDGTKTIKRLEQSFDRVLLDVPCSGSGVIRRNPDSKWKFKVSELERLVALQSEILMTYSKMTKPGGVLVYATCSIFPVENEMQVHEFLRLHPEWEFQQEFHLRPDREGFDGFYAAQLLRKP